MRLGYVTGAVLAMGGMWASALTVTEWNNTKLNDIAVKDESGAVIVLGTEGSWNDSGNTKEKVFDGDSATFFDPPTTASQAGPCWAGIELQEAMIVTRIRYFGRTANKERMYDCLFQAANEADFSDAVTLHVTSEADGWDGTNWGDVHIASEASMTPYKYLRVLAPNTSGQRGAYAGNAGEVEFYGVTEAKLLEKWGAKDPEFTATYVLSTFCINHHFSFGVGQSSRVPFYEVQRKPHDADDSAYVDVGTIPFAYDGYTSNTTQGYLFRDPTPIYGPTDYRARAYHPTKGGSAWYDIGTFTPENIAQGTWIGPKGSWGDDNSTATDGSKAYDGDVATFADLPGTKNKGGWTGLDLGAAVLVKGVRAVARKGWTSRLDGAMVQVATEVMPDPSGKSDYEFVDPVTLGTFSGTTEKAVAEIIFDEPVLARYVRVKSPEDATFNVADFEVDLTPAPQFAPTLTVTMSNLEDEYAALSWNLLDLNLNPRDWVAVFRATGPQGPWTELTDLPADATTYTDETLAVGPRYYYGVALRRVIDNVAFDGPMSVASYRRGRRLDRDPADETTLLNGITPFTTGTIWNNSGNGAPKLFDGDIATYADLNENDAFIGLDMGSAYGVTAVAAYPRSAWASRLNNTVMYGSNDSPSWDNVEQISQPITCSSDQAWTSTVGTSDNLYRYLVLGKPEKSNFNGNLTELRIYGWTQADALSVLTAPSYVTLTEEGTAIVLEWEACGRVNSYTVRRQVNDGEWQDLATNVKTATYTDTSTSFDGTRYSYQIVSVGDGSTANSDIYSIVPYVKGNGTGLYGVYTKNFTHAYDPAEEVALERVDSTIDFDWGEGAPDETVGNDYFRVTWTGKIIIPFNGNYQFRLRADDGARLIIGDTIVVNNWSDSTGAFEAAATVALTAGEHPIRVDCEEQVGNARCQLYWGGCVDEEIVPASQLISEKVAVDTIQEPWLGTRTFGGLLLGLTTFNADGSITLSAGGHDTWNSQEGFRYLWRTVTGPFTCSMKIDFTKVPVGSSNARGIIMIRNGLSQGEPMFMPLADARRRWNVKMRPGSLADGVAIQDVYGWDESAADVCWIQVRRKQDTFIVSVKTAENDEWRELYTYTDENHVFANELFIGPAAGSGSEISLGYVTISDFTLARDGTLILLK